jgi:hypothetical protein
MNGMVPPRTNKNRQAQIASRLHITAVRSGNPDQAGAFFNPFSIADAEITNWQLDEICF